MKVIIEAAGSFCQSDCPYVYPEVNTFYVDGHGVNMLACKYKNICQNAVERYKESLMHHDDEEESEFI